MDKYTHACIKCGASYTDNDPDAYYCPTCFEAKQAAAKLIDAQVASRPPRLPRTSALQEYDNDPNKVRGFTRVSL